MENVITKEEKVTGKEWEQALDKAFKKKVKNVEIAGFRKGAIPKDIYLKKFGIETLYMDAVDIVADKLYTKALKSADVTPVVQPTVDVSSINEKECVLKFTFITAPKVTLGKYKDLKVKKEVAKVTKEEIDEEIKALQNKYAEIKVKEDNAKIEVGDTAIIDFTGTVDGKPLDGGTSQNYPLEIGSKTFIPGFEEGLVGLKVNDETDLNLKFPKDYTKDLANKDVVFHVTIKEIKTRVLPKLNEEFYLDLGFENVKTKEEFNNVIKEQIEKRKNETIEEQYIEDCLAAASDNMKIEINPEILDDEVHRMIHQFEDQLKTQNLTLDNYCEFTHTTHEDLHKQMEPNATKRIKYRYLLENVAQAENIEVSDEEANENAQTMADNYGISKEELLDAYGNLDMIKYDVKMHKALEIVKS